MKLAIQNLSHTYDIEVLKNVQLELDDYNAIGIIGVSGSGKSTLLRLMAGLEKPSSGDIFINEQSVHSSSHRDNIGFVFQHHNLFPHLTLERNISLILEKTRHKSKEVASATARKNLELLHLHDQMHKLPKHVSGGQAQRASIARALSVDPEVILLDEPTSSLDPILTHDVLSAIENLRGLGKNFIFVTHVMSFVRDFADYVIFMHEGEIVEHGSPTILDKPQSNELADFMSKVR